ncbi:MAG TPA: ABC transporter permease, partial [Gemmatimonadaceae bacterium]
MLPTPVRHAWRSLLRTPVFTITAALTLAIGIGALVAMFAIVNGVLLKPLPYGSPERLVGAWFDLPPVSIHKAQQTLGTFFTYKRLARSIENIGVYQEGSANVSDPNGSAPPQRARTTWMSASLIPTLQVPPMLGRVFNEAEDLPNGPPAVMISEGYWRSQYGADPKIIGRTIVVGGSTRQIVGVMPARFRFPSASTQIWAPLQLDPLSRYGQGFNYTAVARLKPGVSVEAAERELVSLLPKVAELFPDIAPGVSTQMLLDQAKPRPFLIPLREDLTGEISRTLWTIAAAAALVLLVACANVANLVLVRADGRQRELAVREALGAGRARVLTHFLGESVILATVA